MVDHMKIQHDKKIETMRRNMFRLVGKIGSHRKSTLATRNIKNPEITQKNMGNENGASEKRACYSYPVIMVVGLFPVLAKLKFDQIEKRNKFSIRLSKKQNYLLIGEDDSVKKIKTRLDYLARGHCYWKPSEVIVIDDKNNATEFEKIKAKNEKEFHLIFCTSVRTASANDTFYMPVKPETLPANIKQKSIVIDKDDTHTDEDVESSLEKMRNNNEIKAFLPIHEFVISDDVKFDLENFLKVSYTILKHES